MPRVVKGFAKLVGTQVEQFTDWLMTIGFADGATFFVFRLFAGRAQLGWKDKERICANDQRNGGMAFLGRPVLVTG